MPKKMSICSLIGVLGMFLMVLGCCDCESDAESGKDGGAEKDNAQKNDSKDNNDDGQPAAINFCNQLGYDNKDTVLELVVGEGEDAVVLSALTGQCNTRPGDDCVEISSGLEIPLVLQNESGEEQYSTNFDVEPGLVYAVYNTMGDDNSIILETGILNENFECSNVACNLGFLNDKTCAPENPCGWDENGECDDDCLDVVDEMFDDSEDCES